MYFDLIRTTNGREVSQELPTAANVVPQGTGCEPSRGAEGQQLCYLPALTLPDVRRRAEGTFGPVACVQHDHAVHRRIAVSCGPACEGGSEKWRGSAPSQLRDHLPVQLSFLTLMQRLGHSPFPTRAGPDLWV